ncbi:MAG: lytic transglycosylase domain-containing protein [Firmicutes bacterium]|nr:lytic transglycosylase domain-containing protein [Bacillota bacterium]
MRRIWFGVALAALVVIFSLPTTWRYLYPIPYPRLVAAAARRYGVSPYLVAAVVRAESKGRPGATSRRGAVGLMQIMPTTGAWAARRMGMREFGPAALRDPATNLAIGTWYLHSLLVRYRGNLPLALAAYNGGEGNVDRWLATRRWRGTEGSEEEIPFGQTRDFVRTVLAAYEAYRRLYARWP